MIRRVLLFAGLVLAMLLTWFAVILLADWAGPLGQDHAVVAPMEQAVRGAARRSAAMLSTPHVDPSVSLVFMSGPPRVRPAQPAPAPAASAFDVYAELGFATTPLLLQLAAGGAAALFVRWRHRFFLRGDRRRPPIMTHSASALIVCAPLLLLAPTTFWLIVSYFEFAEHYAMADHLRVPMLDTSAAARLGILLGLSLLYISCVVVVAQRFASRWARKADAWSTVCQGCGYALVDAACPECGPVSAAGDRRLGWAAARAAGVGLVVLALLASPMTLGIIDLAWP